MMQKKNKETEFNQFWEQHHKQLILNAPKELRDEYVESTQLNSPLDWLCFILPLGIGILVQPYIRLGSFLACRHFSFSRRIGFSRCFGLPCPSHSPGRSSVISVIVLHHPA